MQILRVLVQSDISVGTLSGTLAHPEQSCVPYPQSITGKGRSIRQGVKPDLNIIRSSDAFECEGLCSYTSEDDRGSLSRNQARRPVYI